MCHPDAVIWGGGVNNYQYYFVRVPYCNYSIMGPKTSQNPILIIKAPILASVFLRAALLLW